MRDRAALPYTRGWLVISTITILGGLQMVYKFRLQYLHYNHPKQCNNICIWLTLLANGIEAQFRKIWTLT